MWIANSNANSEVSTQVNHEIADLLAKFMGRKSVSRKIVVFDTSPIKMAANSKAKLTLPMYNTGLLLVFTPIDSVLTLPASFAT